MVDLKIQRWAGDAHATYERYPTGQWVKFEDHSSVVAGLLALIGLQAKALEVFYQADASAPRVPREAFESPPGVCPACGATADDIGAEGARACKRCGKRLLFGELEADPL